ncbi:CPBP family intramembrane glutamic endopeptidase [Aeromicrobium sp. IC_218]|uniref:CPBP family intramembrane glutamic endopeptidase n=1 Tax=Aeromicrobium sp. IC_218 TaxID=2545468 RepID=UPI00103A8086|nr:CPBP family intramembrane glutamic endopeptidase [Aeromicrobium sp. IC_218]TCI97654.1 CPBP family intramembrane metalloprotease [Aeromicrobium sp. IC_218]
MSTPSSGPDVTSGGEPLRPLALWQFGVVVVVYLAIIQLGGLVLSRVGDHDDDLTTVEGVLWSMWLPLGVALVFTYAVVAALGWWRPVLRDDRPVRRWLWVVPVVFLLCSLVAVDYGALSEKSVGFVLALFLATQLVGWGEEGMFRGIGVTALRVHGLTEGKVALWSSVVFGAVHLTNAIGHGAQAIPQALAVSFAGYFFYLTRRVSGGNVVNSVLHGLFDFSLLTGTAILVDQETYLGSLAAVAAYLVVGLVVLVGRRRIEPVPAT